MTERIIGSSGAPASGLGYQPITVYTVPSGKVWTLKHALLVVECLDPTQFVEGGEWTLALESDVSGSYTVITESSLETDNRWVSQGSGPISHTLIAGQHLRTTYYLRSGFTAGDYNHTFSMIYEETP